MPQHIGLSLWVSTRLTKHQTGRTKHIAFATCYKGAATRMRQHVYRVSCRSLAKSSCKSPLAKSSLSDCLGHKSFSPRQHDTRHRDKDKNHNMHSVGERQASGVPWRRGIRCAQAKLRQLNSTYHCVRSTTPDQGKEIMVALFVLWLIVS